MLLTEGDRCGQKQHTAKDCKLHDQPGRVMRSGAAARTQCLDAAIRARAAGRRNSGHTDDRPDAKLLAAEERTADGKPQQQCRGHDNSAKEGERGDYSEENALHRESWSQRVSWRTLEVPNTRCGRHSVEMRHQHQCMFDATARLQCASDALC